MKLDTLRSTSEKPSGFFGLVFVGVFLAGVLWLLYYLALFLVDKGVLSWHRMEQLAIGVPLAWLLGHIVVQTMSDPEACTCKYEFRYFWTEWLHKKRCLSHTLNGK